MSNGQSISIILSPAQVDQVVRAAAQGSTPSFSALISTMNTQRLEGERAAEDRQVAEDGQAAEDRQVAEDGQAAEDRQVIEGRQVVKDGQGVEDGAVVKDAEAVVNGKGYFPAYEDARLSRSLLRGLSILTCFGPGHEERGILELAGQLGMSPSTTHRYVATLVELGLLERCTRSRKYRLAATPSREGNGAPIGEG
jgi:IclR helix-turn-helix domain